MHALRLLWEAHVENVWLRRQERNNLRAAVGHIIEEMPENVFIEHFRLNKSTYNVLCEDILEHTLLRGTTEISLEVKVLCTLSFLATGSYQRIVGVTQHLPQRSASRCIREVVDAINNPQIINKYIVFPQTSQERSTIRQEFQRRFNLPGVIGCIDCTHVAVVKPNEDEHLFFNRKGYHSLNVQMICDHNLLITNVNAKYGGATHDSFIWASSQAEQYMRGLHQNGEQTWLLGDSGYPQRAWLMTPILNAVPGSIQETYTHRHVQARNCIERCFGLLKARWRCLLRHRTLHYHPEVASKIVITCSVLHNMALQARLPPPTDMPFNGENEVFGPDLAANQPAIAGNHAELIHGRAMLNSILNWMA